jgi:hypothetical protein
MALTGAALAQSVGNPNPDLVELDGLSPYCKTSLVLGVTQEPAETTAWAGVARALTGDWEGSAQDPKEKQMIASWLRGPSHADGPGPVYSCTLEWAVATGNTELAELLPNSDIVEYNAAGELVSGQDGIYLDNARVALIPGREWAALPDDHPLKVSLTATVRTKVYCGDDTDPIHDVTSSYSIDDVADGEQRDIVQSDIRVECPAEKVIKYIPVSAEREPLAELFPSATNPWQLSRLGGLVTLGYLQNSWRQRISTDDSDVKVDTTQRSPYLGLELSLPFVGFNIGENGQARLFAMYQGRVMGVTGGFEGTVVPAEGDSIDFEGDFNGRKSVHALLAGAEFVTLDGRFSAGGVVGPVLAQNGTRHTSQEGVTQDSEFEGNGLAVEVQAQAPYILGRWAFQSTEVEDFVTVDIENIGATNMINTTQARSHELILGSPIPVGDFWLMPNLTLANESFRTSGDIEDQESDVSALLVGADSMWNINSGPLELRLGADYGVWASQEGAVDDNRTFRVEAGLGGSF